MSLCKLDWFASSSGIHPPIVSSVGHVYCAALSFFQVRVQVSIQSLLLVICQEVENELKSKKKNGKSNLKPLESADRGADLTCSQSQLVKHTTYTSSISFICEGLRDANSNYP